ncbi:hypothetical protein EVAR_22145_1 [Eumeta japonica]|uniref:Uncharacterized protein n=1 Tax=Eumeta variegata TaxID=151549 RepID=A0A4C1VZK0_EUMVA|nr:hypothetical protein EVAR_22145_1 [Eumeta japonica]
MRASALNDFRYVKAIRSRRPRIRSELCPGAGVGGGGGSPIRVGLFAAESSVRGSGAHWPPALPGERVSSPSPRYVYNVSGYDSGLSTHRTRSPSGVTAERRGEDAPHAAALMLLFGNIY